ncbi:unnamed protein product [Dicrocoelium dendriticum]|nr:unnamed protein product [Dicrocoelium dendriticum]
MDTLHEEIDDLNEETFGCAEAGDWESEHEKFALTQTAKEDCAPDANELPKFWETPGETSFLWNPDVLNTYKTLLDDGGNERGVDVEETLQKLVSEDDAFDDPAILDISKKVADQKLCGSALDKILGAPAYPTTTVDILGNGRDIWSLSDRGLSLTKTGSSGLGLRPTFIACNAPSLSQNVARTTQDYTRTPGNTNCNSHHGPSSRSTIFPSLANLRDDSRQLAFQPPGVQNPLEILRPSFTTCRQSPEYSCSHPSIQSSSTVSQSSCYIPNAEQYGSLIQVASNRLSAQIPVQGQVFNQPLPTSNNPLVYSNPRTSIGPRAAALPFLMMNFLNAKFPLGSLDPRLLSPLTSANVRTPAAVPFPFLTQRVNAINYLGLSAAQAFNSRLPFFTSQPVSPLRASFGTRSSSPNPNMDNNFDTLSVDSNSDEPVDPDTGGWMSRYEKIGVVLMYLRPLVVSNPYIQDYYFAIKWLRQMSQNRLKQLSNGTLPQVCPPPVMHMPSPVTVDDLIDPSQYCRTSLSRRFVVPLVSLPFLHRCMSPHTRTQTEMVDGHPTPLPDVPKALPLYASSPTQSQSTTSETGSTLGRPTRSSLNCPRVVAEVSLASALADDSVDSLAAGHLTSDESPSSADVCGSHLQSTSSTKCTRRRLLLLARIERMYSLILHMDEIDVSLARVLVENDTRNKLLHYKQRVLDRLLRELVTTSTSVKPQSETGDTMPAVPSYMELLGIRKGAHLFSSVLPHLPPSWLQLCLSDLLLRFEEVHQICLSVTEDYHSILFPNLRRAAYQIENIESFMETCFPEVPQSLDSSVDVSPRISTLVNTKLGISLILCLLDTCARLSRPDDPSNFVRYAAYFVHVTTAPTVLHPVEPIEPFSHLASIVPLYVKPDLHSPLTCSQVDRFCRLIDRSLNSSVPVNPPFANLTESVFSGDNRPLLGSSKSAVSLLQSSRDTASVHLAPLLAN